MITIYGTQPFREANEHNPFKQLQNVNDAINSALRKSDKRGSIKLTKTLKRNNDPIPIKIPIGVLTLARVTPHTIRNNRSQARISLDRLPCRTPFKVNKTHWFPARKFQTGKEIKIPK